MNVKKSIEYEVEIGFMLLGEIELFF